MLIKFLAAAVIDASSLALAAAPVTAQAKPERILVCKDIKRKTRNGAIIGAVAGGLLGHTVAGHGNKTGGTLIGAAGGAVVGHEVAKSNARKKQECHYEYR